MKLSRFVLFVALLVPVMVLAETPKKPKDGASEESKKPKPFSVTHHTVTISGKKIPYIATTGELPLKSDEGKTKASVFFVAYTKDKEEDLGDRPVTFCFNGGPGSSSVWLHLGMLGPKRLKLPEDAKPAQPPFELRANPHSLLDVTDLVFIDPVSTGYSRPAKGEKKEQFHGYREDLQSVGQFIHDYVTRFHRWRSPKLLIGESYGGLRAAGLTGHLRRRYNMELNGIVLVSAVLDFQTISSGEANDLPHILFLPTYTATAWYHKALPDDLQKKSLREVVRQAEQFAVNEYALALLQGDSLPKKTRVVVSKEMARLIGLSERFVRDANLRVGGSAFRKELLRSRHQTVGRFDSRYLGYDQDHTGSRSDYDASAAAFFGPYTAAFNDYIREDLDYEDERVYEILTGNIHPWNYRGHENSYVEATDTLRTALTRNPFLKVFVACGYYDLATPHNTIGYSINHLNLLADLRKNITVRFYEAGHMMYVREPSLKKLKHHLAEFYANLEFPADSKPKEAKGESKKAKGSKQKK